MSVTSIDQKTARLIRNKLEEVLNKVGTELNLNITVGKCTYSEDKFKLSIEGSVKGFDYAKRDADAETDARQRWNEFCHIFGFDKEDRGRVVHTNMNKKEYVLHSIRTNCKSKSMKVRRRAASEASRGEGRRAKRAVERAVLKRVG